MRVRLTRRAEAHLESALLHIASDSPRAAATVAARIEHCLDVIGDFPSIGRRSIEPDLREFPVPRTPFVLIYNVADVVEVVAFLHGRQDRTN